MRHHGEVLSTLTTELPPEDLGSMVQVLAATAEMYRTEELTRQGPFPVHRVHRAPAASGLH